MVPPLRVGDIVSYLAESGWQQQPEGWRGASIWQHRGDYEIMVPSHDGMGDGERRVHEVLRCLAALEDRPAADIAADIGQPGLDKQFFRTFPTGHDSGYTSLIAGLQAVQGIRNLLATATRTVLQGPHFGFAGRPPGAVGDVLRAAELGPARAGSYILEVRLAVDMTVQAPSGETVGTRAVLVQMLESISAAHQAVLTREPAAFDETVTAGVSADLCKALSELSGDNHAEPFEIALRWARSQPLEAPTHVVRFPETAGRLLLHAAGRLRDLHASGPATVTGIVEGLHDDPNGDDRWRIKIRGDLSTAHVERSRRAVWVRLADQRAYDQAITAHRERRVVSVAGEMSSTSGRVELVPGRRFDL